MQDNGSGSILSEGRTFVLTLDRTVPSKWAPDNFEGIHKMRSKQTQGVTEEWVAEEPGSSPHTGWY